ncbi:MAG: hypothetical protein ACOC4C_01580 [Fibrobacterota bacterium]
MAVSRPSLWHKCIGDLEKSWQGMREMLVALLFSRQYTVYLLRAAQLRPQNIRGGVSVGSTD